MNVVYKNQNSTEISEFSPLLPEAEIGLLCSGCMELWVFRWSFVLLMPNISPVNKAIHVQGGSCSMCSLDSTPVDINTISLSPVYDLLNLQYLQEIVICIGFKKISFCKNCVGFYSDNCE